ncbi:MAG: PilZ domain-containing protein [Deltaproteobacteria bacterium]|nr:PilZ domain-containing protein [Deltaproteobacteria bacterium]
MGHARVERDRRSNHRVDLDGRAVLFQRGDHVGQYTLENISAGGAMVTGDRDLRPGHLVHLLIDLATGEDTMSLTGSVRRLRDKNNGVSLAIAFPVLSADQEDAIHNAVLRALLRREAAASHLPVLVFEPRRRVREEIESEIRSFRRRGYQVRRARHSLGDARRACHGRGRVLHPLREPPDHHPAGARWGTLRASRAPRKALRSASSAHLEPLRAPTRPQQLVSVERDYF